MYVGESVAQWLASVLWPCDPGRDLPQAQDLCFSMSTSFLPPHDPTSEPYVLTKHQLSFYSDILRKQRSLDSLLVRYKITYLRFIEILPIHEFKISANILCFWTLLTINEFTWSLLNPAAAIIHNLPNKRW